MKKNKIFYIVYDNAKTLIVALIIAILIRSLLFQRESRKKNSDPNNQTINQRVVFWEIGIDIFLNQPVIGYGPGGAKKQYKKYYKNRNTNLKKSNQLLAHNQFITQAINLGALGTIIWVFVLFYSFLKIEKEISLFFVPYLILMFFCSYVRRHVRGTSRCNYFFFFWNTYVVLQFKKFRGKLKI